MQRLVDIRDAIAAIQSYVLGKDFAAFQSERMLHDAVERNIGIISEALRHIPEDLKANHPQISWREVATIGNVLRHANDAIVDEEIWDTVNADLPALLAAV